MGTPHQGGQGVKVGEILLNLAKVRGNTNDSLLKHLEEHSEPLQQQNSDFASISQDFNIKFAYETLPTPLVGGAAKVVSVLHHERRSIISLQPDRSKMVRCGSWHSRCCGVWYQ